MDAAKYKTAATAIPEALEARRNAMGLSREKFAVMVLDISLSTYERWQAGNFNPSLKALQRLEAMLTDWEFVPAQCTPETYPSLAEVWDNPMDDIYDDL